MRIFKTDTLLDYTILEVETDSPQLYTFKVNGQIKSRKYVPITKMVCWDQERDEQCEFELPSNCLLVDPFYLLEEEEMLGESYKPGKHIRTFTVNWDRYECILVEFEDRLQVALNFKEKGIPPITVYSEKMNLPNFKYIMDNIESENDIEMFKQTMERLKL